MIFVFPAVVSKKIDPRFVPAITKSLEIYYLNMVAESITSGTLRISCHFDRKIQNYGPLVLENSISFYNLSSDEIPKEILNENKKQIEISEMNLESVLLEYDEYGDYDKMDEARDKAVENAQKEVDSYRIQQGEIEQNRSDAEKDYQQAVGTREATEVRLKRDQEKLQQLKLKYDTLKDERSPDAASNIRKDINRLQGDIDVTTADLVRAISRETQERKQLEQLNRQSEAIKNKIDAVVKAAGLATDRRKGNVEKSKEDREREKYEKDKAEAEAERRDREARRPSGSYQAAAMTNVDLAPTQIQLTGVDVRFVGGPKAQHLANKMSDDDFAATGGIRSTGLVDYEKSAVNIGTKIIPFTVKDYDTFVNVLLSDYYATNMVTRLKSVWRLILRAHFKAMKWISDKIRPKWLDGEFFQAFRLPKSDAPNLWKSIILNDKGLIDASTFSARKGRAKFLKFSSAIVIADISDLTGEDRDNFMARPDRIQALFHLGWNSFAIVDGANHMLYFASLLENGAVHTMSFPYIYSTLKMDKVYDNLDVLKRQARPFSISSGNILSLGRRIAKENNVRSYIDSKLKTFSS